MLVTSPYNYYKEEPSRLSNKLISLNEKFEEDLTIKDIEKIQAQLNDIFAEIIEIQINIRKLKVNQVHSNEDIAEYQSSLDETLTRYELVEKKLIHFKKKFLNYAKNDIITSKDSSICFTNEEDLMR